MRAMGRKRNRKKEGGERRKRKEKIEESTNLRGKALLSWNWNKGLQ